MYADSIVSKRADAEQHASQLGVGAIRVLLDTG